MKKELRALTGLRGLAAFVVFVAHFEFGKFLPAFDGIFALSKWHNSAVDLFFVLSGFVLMYVYDGARDRFSFITFIRARAARIFPLHLVVCGAFVALAGAIWLRAGVWEGDYSAAMVLLNLGLLQSWPLVSATLLNVPSWSLSVEWGLYLMAFPILFRIGQPRTWISAGLVGFLAVIHSFIGVNAPWYPEGADFMFARGVCGFVCGWLIFRHYNTQDAVCRACTRMRPWLLVLVLAGIVCVGCEIIADNWLILLWPWLVLALAAPDTAATRWLSHGIVYTLGLMSYSLYMWHYFLRLVAEIAFDYHLLDRPLAVRLVYVIGSILLVPLFSLASYRFLEVPA